MEGLALQHGVLRPPSATCSTSATACISSPSIVRLKKSGGVPSSAFAGRRGVKLHCSPTLKVCASKKTFTSFDDMITNSEVPVLVDFYATWCGPCQIMAPVLNEVGAALKDKISIVKVDTEKYPNVASRYGIHALPTFVLFMNGKAINFLEGAHPKDKLIELVTQTLDAEKANINY